MLLGIVMQQQQQMTLPPQNMVFGGVSNGEVLWGLPPVPNMGSPENSASEGGSPEGAVRHGSIAMQGGASGPGLVAGGGSGGNVFQGMDLVSFACDVGGRGVHDADVVQAQLNTLFPDGFGFDPLVDPLVGLGPVQGTGAGQNWE